MINANGASFRVIVVAIAVTAMFMGLPCINGQGTSIPFDADFISPANSTIVSTPIVSTPVSITFRIMGEAPPNQYIWILVNPYSAPGKYWPQGDNHTMSIHGEYPWTVNLGGENDSGKKFDIHLVLVDNKTDQKFVDWAVEGNRTGIYSGLEILQDKLKKLDRITLIRQPTLTITSPPNGNVSPYYTDISGTISGILPDGKYVWIVIGPHDSYGDWYPQGKDHLSPSNQKDWSMQVRIGGEDKADIGKSYDIRAILVDQDTDRRFSEWASKGAEMMANGETRERAYPPQKLPDKAITLDQITVTRGQ
jgi:hypothetical protein